MTHKRLSHSTGRIVLKLTENSGSLDYKVFSSFTVSGVKVKDHICRGPMTESVNIHHVLMT